MLNIFEYVFLILLQPNVYAAWIIFAIVVRVCVRLTAVSFREISGVVLFAVRGVLGE